MRSDFLDRTLSDGATAAADNKTGKGAKFEKFKGSAVRNCITKLTTPACVAESCEEVAFGNGRRSSTHVGLLVVMIWEVIERLKGDRSIGLKGDAISAGGVNILEGMDGSFVVLLVRRVLVGRKKRKTGSNIRRCPGR